MKLSNRPEDFPGYFATILWVAVGVFLFWTTPGAAFLSWQALVYFVGGTVSAGIIFGLMGMTVQRYVPGLKKGRSKPDDPLTPLIGTLYGAAQIVIVYFLAKAVVTQMLFPPVVP
jgi:hypothetical protein